MGINYQLFDTNRVESDFRPLLDIIDVATLEERLRDNLPLSYKDIGKYISFVTGIPSRLVIFMKDNLNGFLGYSYFSHADGIYSFIICLSRELFYGEKYKSQKYRKIIFTHEYTHFISSVFCIPSLDTPKQIDVFKKEYAAKMTLEALTEQFLEQIEKTHLGGVMDHYTKPHIFFEDSHYRLKPDKTKTNYSSLPARLLLPIDKFESFFNKSEMRTMKNWIKKNNISDAYGRAFTKIAEIAKATDFEEVFIARRIKEILISYIV
jgi:hypothetical protein